MQKIEQIVNELLKNNDWATAVAVAQKADPELAKKTRARVFHAVKPDLEAATRLDADAAMKQLDIIEALSGLKFARERAAAMWPDIGQLLKAGEFAKAVSIIRKAEEAHKIAGRTPFGAREQLANIVTALEAATKEMPLGEALRQLEEFVTLTRLGQAGRIIDRRVEQAIQEGPHGWAHLLKASEGLSEGLSRHIAGWIWNTSLTLETVEEVRKAEEVTGMRFNRAFQQAKAAGDIAPPPGMIVDPRILQIVRQGVSQTDEPKTPPSDEEVARKIVAIFRKNAAQAATEPPIRDEGREYDDSLLYERWGAQYGWGEGRAPKKVNESSAEDIAQVRRYAARQEWRKATKAGLKWLRKTDSRGALRLVEVEYLQQHDMGGTPRERLAAFMKAKSKTGLNFSPEVSEIMDEVVREEAWAFADAMHAASEGRIEAAAELMDRCDPRTRMLDERASVARRYMEWRGAQESLAALAATPAPAAKATPVAEAVAEVVTIVKEPSRQEAPLSPCFEHTTFEVNGIWVCGDCRAPVKDCTGHDTVQVPIEGTVRTICTTCKVQVGPVGQEEYVRMD